MSPPRLSDLPRAIGEQLPGVPTAVGFRELGKHKSPPCYTWVPVGGPIDGPHHPPVRQPALVGRWRCRWEVHCWGRDIDEATLLVAALATAALAALRGRRFDISNVEAHPQTSHEAGFLWVATLELQIDLPATDNTALPVVAQTTSTEIETAEQADPATSTSGDDTLEGTET